MGLPKIVDIALVVGGSIWLYSLATELFLAGYSDMDGEGGTLTPRVVVQAVCVLGVVVLGV